MATQATNLADLVAMTQKDLGRPKYTEIATDLQSFTAFNELLNANRVELRSGYQIQWDVMVRHAQSARNVGLGESDEVNIPDTMVQATADWRNTVASYAFIGQEIDFNRDPARIVDLVKQRRHSCMIGIAQIFEDNFWGPPVAASDDVTPWGINTWLVKNASTGFYGGAPSGYTTIGLNPTTYERWKNYTSQYTAVSKDDLNRRMRRAARYCNFKPPVAKMVNPSFNTGNNWAFYSNYAVVGAMEEILESQNENLGKDVASMDGEVIFLRSPLNWVPKLDADTTNPVYGLNWGEFKTYVLQGWWLKETNVPVYPGQHTLQAHFMDCTYQWVTTNRRCHFVIATGTTYPS